MSKFAIDLLDSVKLTLRETGKEFDSEILDYIETCITDLQTAGILSSYFEDGNAVDPQIKQAVRWYCLGTFGLYNTDMEKYLQAYQSLKATLCTQSKYTEVQDGIQQ